MNVEKSLLHGVSNEITALEKRIQLLKQQEAKEQQLVGRHREQTKRVLDKKLEISEIQKLKERDSSKDVERVELQRRRNQQRRSEHEQEMNTILKACYLVKLDEARELKNLSIQHEKKIQEIKGEIYSEKRQKQEKIKELTDNSKLRYREYWRNRLSELYSSQEMTAQELAHQKEEKARYLKSLEEQEIKLLERINKIHSHTVESKKEYITALNIPVKEIGDLVQSSKRVNSSMEDVKTVKADTERTHKSEYKSQQSSHHNSPMKIPKTNLNEAKLRHILNELKKSEGTQHLEGDQEKDRRTELKELERVEPPQ